MKLVDYSTADILTILSKVKTLPSEKLESETVEFKEFKSENSFYQGDRLISSLCSFANRLGGVLIVGVKDSSNLKSGNFEEQLVGFPTVDKDEAEKRIRGKIQSQINFRVENINFESKNYTAIYIVRNPEILVTTASGKIYIREGRDSRPMRPEEIESAVKSLQNYDWSADNLHGIDLSALNNDDVQEALNQYVQIRNLDVVPTKENFLEAIGITKNGVLTRGGILFLGKSDIIAEHLGDYEFRFSWKEGTELKINEIWSGNLWSSINRARKIFSQCVSEIEIEFKENKYRVPNLDPVAFHEAFINAVVHRDYSLDGMISIEFSGGELSIISPGLFYGGINVDNIAVHEPRHRNKDLARILMNYRFVDRAGMGVLRIGVKSLVYGRGFPKFEELNGCVKVSMQAEYIRPAIFFLTHGKQRLYLSDLILLNTLHKKSHISLQECFNLIKRVCRNTWQAINELTNRWENYVELFGSNEKVGLRIKDDALEFFDLRKSLRAPSNSDKFVKLLHLLKNNGGVSNEEISQYLGFRQSQSTSRFLRTIKWIEKTGEGVTARYIIKRSSRLTVECNVSRVV